MPEGDSLAHARLLLEPALAGRVVTEFWARKIRGIRPRAGQRIEAVRSVGKNLLVDFDRDLSLQIHLGMAGWFRLLDPARTDSARRNPRLRLLIGVDDAVAACFAAPTIQTFIRSDPERDPTAHLGPDLAAEGIDLDAVLDRLDRYTEPGTLLVDALLDQRIAAGIGNVYKSEVLHACRLAPGATVGELDIAERRALFETAHRQLVANSRTRGRRATAPDGGVFVYGRERLGCKRCGSAIRMSRNGTSARSTYWCPSCQPDR